LEDFRILHKSHEFVKLGKFGLFEDFHVLYYIKVTNFIKFTNFGILEDLHVL